MKKREKERKEKKEKRREGKKASSGEWEYTQGKRASDITTRN